MASEVTLPVSPHHVILYSQLVLPKRKVVLPAVPEHSESLWARVNRICDQYMPERCDMRLDPNAWRTPEENAQK